jgi:hypothetical protein
MFFCTYTAQGSPVSLHHAREIDVTRIGVAVARLRRELQPLVRHHRDQLAPLGGLEWLPGLTATPGPGGRLESRRVRQQHPQRDAIHRAIGVVDGAELRHPTADGIVEGEQTAVAQLEHGDRGEGLGDGGPVIDRRVPGPAPAGAVGEPVVMPRDDAAVAHQHRRTPHHVSGLRERVEAAGNRRPGAAPPPGAPARGRTTAAERV